MIGLQEAELMKRALVTLAVGERYLQMFDRYCRGTWHAYAERHHMDLVVLPRALDDSPRAQSRSVSWQKCLVLSAPEIAPYEQVVWVDADILINPMSPDVGRDVPVDRIGAADEYATPTKEDYEILLRRKYAQWSAAGEPYISNLTPTEYHTQFGLEGHFDSVVQAGVLVISPRFHRDLLEHVYRHYEDKGAPEWNFEMRPLSYEILTNRLEHWISPKFNMPWASLRALYYPFVDRLSLIDKGLRKSGLRHGSRLSRKCATTAFLNNYFLHFSGGEVRDMGLVDLKS